MSRVELIKQVLDQTRDMREFVADATPPDRISVMACLIDCVHQLAAIMLEDAEAKSRGTAK